VSVSRKAFERCDFLNAILHVTALAQVVNVIQGLLGNATSE
jgi:hypothetical protein